MVGPNGTVNYYGCVKNRVASRTLADKIVFSFGAVVAENDVQKVPF